MGLTREQLLKKLNIIREGPDLEAITKKSLADYEDEAWKSNSRINTSFHCSNFPGRESDYGCQQIYTLLNIPHADKFPSKLAGQASMGEAAEKFIIDRWEKSGILVSYQEPFEDPETWLSGKTDAILNIPPFRHILPVDIKSKDHDVIKSMNMGARGYDEKHFMQIQAYIYLCRKFHWEKGWNVLRYDIEPCKSGMIYYVSRQDPTFSKQFYIEADEEVIERGVENLKKFKQLYLEDKIPQRPKGQLWGQEPCKWCPFKREAMKKDYKDLDKKLSESEGIKFASTVYSSYNPDQIRKEVLKRWQKEST